MNEDIRKGFEKLGKLEGKLVMLNNYIELWEKELLGIENFIVKLAFDESHISDLHYYTGKRDVLKEKLSILGIISKE